jgi:hypothetical protein
LKENDGAAAHVDRGNSNALAIERAKIDGRTVVA